MELDDEAEVTGRKEKEEGVTGTTPSSELERVEPVEWEASSPERPGKKPPGNSDSPCELLKGNSSLKKGSSLPEESRELADHPGKGSPPKEEQC